MSQVTNGHMETTVDWVPGLKAPLRLRDFPSLIRTTDPADFMLNFIIQETATVPRARALILNTFDAFEPDALVGLSTLFPSILTVGPLQLMNDLHLNDDRLRSLSTSLWKEDPACLAWLDARAAGSVVYVNFGSITVMTAQQLTEFAWGLANSGKPFLWIIRPDIVAGDAAMLAPEFVEETRDRGLMVSWCPQEQVLGHPAIGGFLTHSGWNSTLESVINGVPVICWPFFAEQQTNCRFSCVEWGMGMEIDSDVKREEVERQVREMMDGEKGSWEMRERAAEWKRKAEEAAAPGGSSFLNLEKLIEEVLLN